jgi:transcriptional regulator with GAF, ATPase, and Fis domain
MVVDSRDGRPTLAPMPVEQEKLNAAQRRRLRKATERIDQARLEWAKTVRELGIAACAREIGITPQALHARVKTIERAAK